MDAQHAADLDQKKSSPSRASPQQQQQSPVARSPKVATSALKSASPKDVRLRRDSGGDRDSDAETIVLPGKDGHTPSKVRKVRQEDRSDGERDASKIRRRADSGPRNRGHGNGSDSDKPKEERRPGPARASDMTAIKTKRRLSTHTRDRERDRDRDKDKDREKLSARSKDGSSGLSSAPTSPPRRRLSHVHDRSSSDSERNHEKSYPSKTLREKLKSGERLLPNKRKATRTDSDDDEDNRKARRQRTTSAGLEGARHSRDLKIGASRPLHDSRNRSVSPPSRMHRRSASSQLPSHSSNGAAPKKKRVPPPLQSTDYHSDESSASNSPHLRHTKIRSLATPASADANTSPMKLASHKKHLDAHGQTLLARACARGEYDAAKHRLGDRPEDLNVADYAGNTPLQIAAINGCEDIVKLLIDAGCNLDCVNYDKDTPLLDAVDNGHLGVVKLLLDAGVNPRKANRTGDEPIDRVTEETDNAEEIRAALMEAKKRAGGRTKTSEDPSHHDHDAPESPRHSPAVAMSSHSLGRRGGTVRSTKTRNDLLYMPLDDKTLRSAASQGDEETVGRILQIKDGFDDPESMVAAARGGHDLVMQLLLGLGGANPDPAPVDSQPREFATPMLAAIGQENIKVVELLLEQQSFDPTKRFKGETYYEVARRRQGTNSKEEEQMLKNAYDAYKKGKTKSPGRRDRERERDRDREEKRARRDEKEERLAKRSQISPSRERETEPRKKTTSKVSSPTERKKHDPQPNTTDDTLQKRGIARQRKDDRLSTQLSDREASPSVTHKMPKAKRAESEITAMSSEGEAVKPRRKLVSKGELRDKQRRPSMASNAPTSPRESRHDESSEKTKLSDKYRDRAKALKRDGSRETGDSNTKRHRTSLTPDRPGTANKDDSELPVKRRKLESETSEKRQKRLSSDSHVKSTTKSSGKRDGDDSRDAQPPNREASRKESVKAAGRESSVRIKSEDVDVEMPDAAQRKDPEPEDEPARQKLDEELEKQKREKALAQQEAKRAEERKRAEAEAQKKKLQEEEAARKRKEEEEAEAKRKKEEEERQAKRKQEEAEAEQRRIEAEKKRLAEEAARREEEEKAQREAEEKRRLEDEKRKQEEEERRKREEEERLRKEREAAEEARRLREEEERKERERRERAHREEMERKRAAREAEQRRIREEQERIRLDKLPPLLRWLDRCPNPKHAAYVEKFKHLQGVRYDTIRPEANRTTEGREQWVLNIHAALLLGEKDLALSRYTAWERAPVSHLAKLTLWRLEASMYTMTLEKFWDIGRQVPGYYGTEDPSTLSFQTKERLRQEAWERFRGLDMFFIKLSDLLYTIPNIPHLRGVKLAVEYRELMENESQAMVWRATQKWKQDPDANRFHGFAPKNKYYINGMMVGEDMPVLSQTSKTPFPEERVPRRGLIRVFPNDPEYTRICHEQGLDHLVNGRDSPSMPNGVHSPASADTPAKFNGSKDSDQGTNGAHITTNGSLLNGVANAAH